jgi:hypothetical protein
MKRILGPMREETEGWTGLYNEKLHNLYSPANINRVIISWMSWMDM